MRSDSSPSVRSRTFTEEARRAQILGCAIDVLAELGYAHTSFARIAERVGVSKSVISYHFAGKDELLEQVIRSVHAQAADHMIPRSTPEPSAAGALTAYVRSNLEFVRDHQAAIDAVTEILVNWRGREGSPRVSGRPEVTLTPLLEIPQRGHDDGVFVAFDAHTMAWSIRSLIDGLTRQRRQDPEFDVDTSIDELVALIQRATRGVVS